MIRQASLAGARYDFSGRVAVVSGGMGGLGQAITKCLMDAGASVAVWDARADLTQAAGALAYPPERISLHKVDITDEAAVVAAAKETVSKFGHIDTLVNNAGILGPVVDTWEHTAEQFRRVLDVNLVGASGPWRARIVNVASIQGKEGMPQASAYAASKAGLIALTKTLGKELADSGILVNAITPAAVMTDMSLEITQERMQSILARIPMGRFLLSEEVAAQVMWLCSADCSFATGAVFDLSGGRATY